MSSYPYNKCKIITDIFGERHYIKEVFFDKKFNIEFYHGRPISNTIGRNKFIITSELEAFIFSTLKVPNKEFIGALKKSAVINLRRILRNNPFPTYARWQKSTKKDKPKFITFNNARNNPEVIKDYFENRFVVLSAIRTDEGLVCPMGVSEELYLDGKSKGTKRYIVTPEIARILQGNHFYPHKIRELFPFNDQTLASMRSELGYNAYKDRNTWLALHMEEILNHTAKNFCSKYSDMKIPQYTIASLKTHASMILRLVQLESNSSLLRMLNNYWQNPSGELRGKINKALGEPKSKKTRRVYAILKEARLI